MTRKRNPNDPENLFSGIPSPLLTFETFTLDIEKHALYQASGRIRLTAKPLQVLECLVGKSGTTVSKRELLDIVWKDLFVTEDVLVQAVGEIRKTLGDDKDNPRFIQTIPREGYRFIARVCSVHRMETRGQVEPYPLADFEEKHSTETPGAKNLTAEGQVPEIPLADVRLPMMGRIWAYLALFLLLACGLAYLVWVRISRSGNAWGQPVMIAQVAGTPRMPSFAPDGSIIAFVNEVNGTDQIFVKHGGQGTARQLTFGDLPARRPRWSPRNDQILFSLGEQPPASSSSFGNQAIWSVPPLGGVPHLVIEGGRNPNWSRDGTRIVFERRDEVWTAGSDGRNQSRVEGIPHAAYLLADRMPAFSPDGTQIIFFHPQSGVEGDLWVIPVQRGVPKRLTLDVFEGGYPVWTPDGRSIIFMSQRSGIADLWRISPSGGNPEHLFGATGENSDPEISADGRKLAFSNTRNQYVLTILDPASGRTRELLERRLAVVHPMFSPRGDKVAFFAAEGDRGFNQISTIDADGANLNQVTRDNKERNYFPHWSGDGASLYHYRSLPDLSFRRIPITGGVSEVIVDGWSWETNYGARVDASGEWIVYTETKAGAPFRTLIRNIKSGKERALARALDDPRWSADATYVLGTDLGITPPPQGDVSICPANGKECRKLARGYLAVWSFDNRSVYFLRTAGYSDRAELRSISVTGDNERTLAELRPMRPIGHYYDVSPRGEIVYVQFKPGKRDLWLAEIK
ncbi:MAG: serine/threonine protein kinase [Acidobacteria bacterium]|nr:serine/threonine protein kinase [Acidobacteriota bacterium]